MRKVWYLLPLLALLLLLGMNLFPRSGARAILDRAIEAHGGDVNLARVKTARLKGTSRQIADGAFGPPSSWEEILRLPHNLKRTIRQPFAGGALVFTHLYRDGKCWIYKGKEQMDVIESEPDSILVLLDRLVQMRKQDVPLTQMADEQVQGRAAVGIE